MNKASALELVELRATFWDRRGRTLRARLAWLLGWRLVDLRQWRRMSPPERGIIRAFVVPPRLVAGIPRHRYRVGRWLKPALALAAVTWLAWYLYAAILF